MITVERAMKLRNREIQLEFHREYDRVFERGDSMRYKGILNVRLR